MKTFRQIFSEKFAGYVKTDYHKEPVEIEINPTWSEIRKIAGNRNTVRGLWNSKTDDLYVWDSYSVIHYSVIDDPEMKLKNDIKYLVGFIVYINNEGFIDDLTVTDVTRNSIWNHNPKLLNAIFASKNLDKLFTEYFKKYKDLTYYDETIVGKWHDVQQHESYTPPWKKARKPIISYNLYGDNGYIKNKGKLVVIRATSPNQAIFKFKLLNPKMKYMSIQAIIPKPIPKPIVNIPPKPKTPPEQMELDI